MHRKIPKTPATDVTRPPAPDEALDSLKRLLLGEEQQQLEEINERLEDPELRSEDLAEVLPDAVRLSDNKGDELTDALEPPVTQCIERSIQRDPTNFANALYPVMGPAIRQSISNTLKGLVDNINRSLEQSFSLQGLKWRLEARRSGVPFAEIVLRHTLAFRVEQVFLIQPGSGLLMQHVQDELVAKADADAISGMLTAITQFVKDAFKAEENEGLETVEMGDHTVLLVHGPDAYLAAVVRGVPPTELRRDCQGVLENLHARFRTRLAEFEGDPASLEPLVPLLERCLQSRTREVTRHKGPSAAFIIALLLMLALAAWLGFKAWQHHKDARDWQNRQQHLVQLLDDETGVTVTDVVYGDRQLQIRGLRDPLARSTAELVNEAGIDSDQVNMQWRTYHDLEPRFVLQRARQKLAPPGSVSLELQDGVLIARGYADPDWLGRARLIATAMSGVNGFNDEQLDPLDTHLLKQVNALLSPPPGVDARVREKVLSLSGNAPLEWIQNIDVVLEPLSMLEGIDRRELVSEELLKFEQLQSRIENTFIYFSERAELGQGEQHKLSLLLPDIEALRLLGSEVDRAFHVLLIGSADGLGPAEINAQLALGRALLVRDYLIGLGLPGDIFRWQTRVGQLPVLDPALRRTEFRIVPQEGGQP